MSGLERVVAFVISAGIVCAASGQSWQNDYTWCHVGSAGNRAATAQEAPIMPGIGSVGYEFNMSQVPVTVGQYWEFVEAYLPHYESPGANFDFTGNWIHIDLQGNVFPPEQQWLNRPARPSFEYAARYVNWLHNGKVNESWAFESGVYDTSTFTGNSDGTYNHVAAPAAGATVWIPTIDEWTKAFHYDPSKNGGGEEGYWLYPHSSDIAPIPGLPGEGGETDAGSPDFLFLFQDVGSYPNAASPWGLLDASGGEREWLSASELGSGRILIPDSSRGNQSWELTDRLDWVLSWPPQLGGTSFRLVTAVPGPSVLPALWCVAVYSLRRQGRSNDTNETLGFARIDRCCDERRIRGGQCL